MANKNKPFLPDIQTIVAMGINPKTGLPYKISSCASKGEIKKVLRIVDEQDAVNRYKWYNLPLDISSQELERLLYYKGQLIFFYSKELKQFFITSFALDGPLDSIGRYTIVHPIAINGGSEEDEKHRNKALDTYLSTLKLKVTYGVLLEDELKEEDLYTRCVILRDYSNQRDQQNIPRQTLNDPILDLESECIPMMRTALIATSGVKGMRVSDADQIDGVYEANEQIRNGAITGDINIPIEAKVDFQDLSSSNVARPSEFMLAMQSLDNFRLSTYGLKNGGLFEKKQHILESENKVNQSAVDPVMQDGLSWRQNFCNIVNSIWNCGTWVDPSENETTDINGDGVQYDINDGTNSGVQGGGEEDGSDL